MNRKASPASGRGRGIRLRRDGPIAAVLVCVTAFAAACGGPGGSAMPGYVNGTPGSPAAFAACMRANGVPSFPNPSGDGFNLTGINQNSPQFRHAGGICGGSGTSSGSPQEAQGLAAGLDFARCMRANGVRNYADPVSNGHGGFTSHGSTGSGADPHSPLFQAAQRACRSALRNGSSGNGSAG